MRRESHYSQAKIEIIASGMPYKHIGFIIVVKNLQVEIDASYIKECQ